MKDVSQFLLKKVFKSRLNWIILALFASVLGVTFYFNSQTANSVSLETRLETHLAANERAINENEEKLAQMSDTSSEEYQIAKSNLDSQKNLLTQKKEILTLLKEGRWKEAYYLQWQDEEKNYEFVSNNPTSSSDLKMAVDRERKIYQVLYLLNIKAHNLDYPTHGIDQIVWILEAIIPTLFVIAIIFMLTQLFAERYQNNLDTAQLYPFSKVTFAMSSLGVGVGYVSVLFIGICSFSFLVGSLISGFGQLDYPYPIYSLTNQEVTIGKIQDVLFPSLLLAFLAFIVIVEVVYLIAYFFKQKMPVLFLSLIGIVGLLFGIQTIQPLQRIAHLIPFTYLRSVEILSGRLPKQIDNVNLNWEMGLVLLPCLIILLLVGILFIERWGSSRKKEVFKA
ncbi:membrane protein [Streptococcus pneumoniae]|uniref:membrane protein n=1 Tax=Streptococcus pneumoniae TaxID=1313 RepID=UPI000598D5D0|nr:membrane protein [Streptococcus pneumoniae]CEO61124.1 ABC-type transport system involved in multi-copper enzyme maturation%2C permease component [Streptococcus pneumoniae]CEO63234.1 ABC-type transport system involved in multi-copper enzyme maturation%2C permease component [Streptococcus pneumoniae]CEV56185.1 ABC-type transport system involved in multi-copper enzyme maturation%2C permease component [Streptococcus pneumoniae]CEV59665.1 ABC-type transport system involved in multi-copper enzyme 